MKIFFKIFADQSMDNDAENNVATTTTPKRQNKIVRKQSKTIRKPFKMASKSLEKTFQTLYVLACANCFGLLSNSD